MLTPSYSRISVTANGIRRLLGLEMRVAWRRLRVHRWTPQLELLSRLGSFWNTARRCTTSRRWRPHPTICLEISSMNPLFAPL